MSDRQSKTDRTTTDRATTDRATTDRATSSTSHPSTSRRIARVELARLLQIEEGFIRELEDHEIVRVGDDGTFDVYAVERVRVCWTMQRSFGVNLPGLEVALDLLERWQDERARARALLEQLRRERESSSLP